VGETRPLFAFPLLKKEEIYNGFSKVSDTVKRNTESIPVGNKTEIQSNISYARIYTHASARSLLTINYLHFDFRSNRRKQTSCYNLAFVFSYVRVIKCVV